MLQQRRMRKRNKKQPTENALIKKRERLKPGTIASKNVFINIVQLGIWFLFYRILRKTTIATICNLLYVQSNFHLLKLHGRLATTNKDDNANQKLKRRERRKEKHQEETATHVVCAFLFGFIEVCRSNRTTIVHFFLDFFFIFEL